MRRNALFAIRFPMSIHCSLRLLTTKICPSGSRWEVRWNLLTMKNKPMRCVNLRIHLASACIMLTMTWQNKIYAFAICIILLYSRRIVLLPILLANVEGIVYGEWKWTSLLFVHFFMFNLQQYNSLHYLIGASIKLSTTQNGLLAHCTPSFYIKWPTDRLSINGPKQSRHRRSN